VKTCFILGREAFIKELTEVGLEIYGGLEHDNKTDISYEDLKKTGPHKKVDAVLCSYDYKFNLYKLVAAS
jgi:hypothetical protein